MYDDPMLNPQEFHKYIMENYKLDDVSSRLVLKILIYIEKQMFADQEDVYKHLSDLLDGAFGLSEDEIKMCHFV